MSIELDGQLINASLVESYEEQKSPREPKEQDLSDLPRMPQRFVILKVPSGEIAVEQGADGLYLRFDCDCLHALPVCQAQCCGLIGTVVHQEEMQEVSFPVEWDDELNQWVLQRASDGFCRCLDRDTRLCGIYSDRPHTCRQFHCTKGSDQRGWKLPNRVTRQSKF